MSRGGFRKGAGRKKEYNEPVQKILIGLPQSVLQQLDDYAQKQNLSRPKAIALLLESVAEAPKKKAPSKKQNLLQELKALKESMKQ